MAFINNGIKNGDLIKSKKKIGGYQSWYHKIKNVHYTKDSRHKNLEMWDIRGHKAKHLGPADPRTGELIPGQKANHPVEWVS